MEKKLAVRSAMRDACNTCIIILILKTAAFLLPGLKCVCGDKKRRGLTSFDVEVFSNKNAFRALWCVLPDWRSLESLTLHECQLNREWFWAALARQTAEPYNLKKLDVTVLGDEGQGMELDSIQLTMHVNSFFSIFVSNDKPLEQLSLTFNQCEGKCFIMHCGEEPSFVCCEKFELTHHFNDEFYNKDMATQIRLNPALKHLTLKMVDRYHESMSTPAIRALHDKVNPLLETITFSDLSITAASFNSLRCLLPKMTHLRELHLVRSLKRVGKFIACPQFIVAMRRTPTLCLLELTGNKLGAHAAALLKALVDADGERSTHLHSLRLDGNDIPMKSLSDAILTLVRRRAGRQEKVLDILDLGLLETCHEDKATLAAVLDGMTSLFDSCDLDPRSCLHCLHRKFSGLFQQ